MHRNFYVFLSAAIIIFFLLHWMAYRAVIAFFFVSSDQAINILRAVFFVFGSGVFLASSLAFRFNNFLTRFLYITFAIWLGFCYFLLLAAILTWSIFFLSEVIGINSSVQVIGQWLFTGAVLISVYSIVNANIITVKKLDITLPNLPRIWKGRTAVWASDLHLGQVRNLGFAKKVAEQIRVLKPDIVFIGGDLYDGVAGDYKKLAAPFGQISAPLGIYFITGNHEEFGDPTPFLEAVKSAGIKVLLDEKVEIDGVKIIGIDYADTRHRAQLFEDLSELGVKPNEPNILLSHEPDRLGVAEMHGIALQLSGHTHVAQIFPMNIFTHLIYHGFDYGFKKHGDMQVYTSSGVGTWGPPMRFGNQPEIVKITFR